MGPSPAKLEALAGRMAALNILRSDIEEHFVHSSGHGGQNINKVSTCVYLKHLPTGIEVKCQDSRSQFMNRFLAQRRLVEKIEEQRRGAVSERRMAIEKIRRQKRKRSRRAKQKMLKNKAIQGEKKRNRSNVQFIVGE
jgi:protein subunit release factor B